MTAVDYTPGEARNPVDLYEDACPGCGEHGDLSYTGNSLRRDLLLDPHWYEQVRRCFCGVCGWHGWARKAVA